jgi:hypothetical protein
MAVSFILRSEFQDVNLCGFVCDLAKGRKCILVNRHFAAGVWCFRLSAVSLVEWY